MTKKRMTAKDLQKEAMLSRIKGNELDYIEQMILSEVVEDMNSITTIVDDDKDDDDE